MASPPLTYLEKKWASNSPASNLLHESATQNTDRKSIPYLDYDTHRNVSGIGRRVMLSLGRWLCANFSAVRGAIREQATFAGNPFVAQYIGRNAAWGDQAELWLEQHDKIIDVRGQQFNMEMYRRNLIWSVLRDGDMGTVLVKTANGYPMIQCIPAHRIGSRLNETTVRGGAFDGSRIIDGVIVGDQGQALAYRVMGENPFDYSRYVDVPVRDMFLTFVPEFVDQVRGFSNLASGLFDWQDVAERRRFELLAAKIGASIAIIEKNQDGEATPGAPHITPASSTDSTAGTATGLVTEMLDGGTTRYIRSSDPNACIEPFENNRPSSNQQAFEATVVRAAFHGMGWSVDFSLDPSKVGRAEMRIVIDKLNREIKNIGCFMVKPAMMRINGFRLSVAIELDILPDDLDWWMWDYQGPAKFTADAKNESDMAINEHNSGHRTWKSISADNSAYWEDEQDQLIAEEVRLQAKCKAAGVDPNRIRLIGTATMSKSESENETVVTDEREDQKKTEDRGQRTAKNTVHLKVGGADGKKRITHHRDKDGAILWSEVETVP